MAVQFEFFRNLFQRHVEPLRCDTVGVATDDLIHDDYAFRLSMIVEDPEWLGSLTCEEEVALRTYLEPSRFHLLNRALYDVDSIEDPDDLRYFLCNLDLYKHLDEAIYKYRLGAPIMVMRGLRESPFDTEISKDLIGKEIIFNSYLSTVMDPRIMRMYGYKVRLVIMVPRGKGVGICLRSMNPCANVEEFLFKRGSRMRVLSVSKDEDDNDSILLGFLG